jgi:hypothetical protein
VVFVSKDNKMAFQKKLTDEDLVPANWSITTDGPIVHASNNQTGRIFTGTMAQFNDLLHGILPINADA